MTSSGQYATGVLLPVALQDNLDTAIEASSLMTAQAVSALMDARPPSATADEVGSAANRTDPQDATTAAAQRRAVVQVLDGDGAVIVSSNDFEVRARAPSAPGRP